MDRHVRLAVAHLANLLENVVGVLGRRHLEDGHSGLEAVDPLLLGDDNGALRIMPWPHATSTSFSLALARALVRVGDGAVRVVGECNAAPALAMPAFALAAPASALFRAFAFAFARVEACLGAFAFARGRALAFAACVVIDHRGASAFT